MSARENGMHSSITTADLQEAFLQGYHFEGRLHCARKEAESVKGSISWAEVTENDVLGGKGRRFRDHAGNIFFRVRCKFYSEEYFRTPLTEMIKSDHQFAIRLMTVDDVLSTGGRFLIPYLSGRNVYWKNMLGDNKTLREKIQCRMKDSKERPPTVAGTEGDTCPVSAMVGLDMNSFLDEDNLSLDMLTVNETNVFSDLKDADWDDDRPSTVTDIVVDMSPTSAMEDLDRNRHLDEDTLVLDWSHTMNEANWDDARPQTVADTEGDIRPTSTMDNLDRKTFLHQDKLILDASNLQEPSVNFELDEGDWSTFLSF